MITKHTLSHQLNTSEPMFELFEKYRAALEIRANNKLIENCPNLSTDSRNRILKLGTSAQSWVVTSDFSLQLAKNTESQIGKFLDQEEFNLAGGCIPHRPPFWHFSYALDKPGIFEDNANPEFLSFDDVAEQRNFLFQAETELDLLYPCAFQEYKQIISHFVFFKGSGDVGGTTPKSYGTIYLARWNKSPIDYANTIVHETAHTILNTLRSTDPIINQNSPKVLFSPLRKCDRPTWGVVHSAFSLYRMVNFLHCAINKKSGKDQNVALSLYLRFHKTQGETLKILESISWTEFGQELFDLMKREYDAKSL